MTGRPGVFVDTSALYAVLDRDDDRHADAERLFGDLLDELAAGHVDAVTHSWVLVESSALVQRRLGIGQLRALLTDLVPILDLCWVDAELCARATAALLASGRRGVSLVDWTSFEMMRDRGIDLAFAFDEDFADQGFTLLS